MSCYALDTNIISYLLRGNRELQKRIYREVNDGGGVIIPLIAYYEIKRGLVDSNATTKLTAFERLCYMLGMDDMDVKTLDVAANIYASKKRQGSLIEDADILIAASCIAHGYVLVTNNERHFAGINGLCVANWS
jgi:predicted nucleic acid-binding protein